MKIKNLLNKKASGEKIVMLTYSPTGATIFYEAPRSGQTLRRLSSTEIEQVKDALLRGASVDLGKVVR